MKVKWSNVGFWLIVIVLSLYLIAPLYVLIKISISGGKDVFTAHPSFLVHDFTWKHWSKVLASGYLWPSLRRSLIVATATTVVAVIIAAPAAYVISRLPRGTKYVTVLALFFTRMFPEVSLALPIAVNFIKWGMMDTHVGLVLAHLIMALPFVAWVLVGTYETIPVDLEEAACVDGAGKIGTLMRVVLPLAAPGIAVAAIFTWLMSWNEFTYALYLSLSTRTLPLLTYYYSQRGGFFDAPTYATILTIPVFIVTLFLQRWMRTGYLAGAVKG